MAVAVQGGASTHTSASTSTTLSYSVGANASHIVAHAATSQDSASRDVTSVTFDGDALTQAVQKEVTEATAWRQRSEQWYKTSPANKTANVVANVASAADTVALTVAYITGAEPQAPEATVAASDTTNPEQISITTLTADAGVTAAVAGWRNNDTGYTPDSGTTEDAEDYDQVPSEMRSVLGHLTSPGAVGSKTLGWTHEGSSTLEIHALTACAWAIESASIVALRRRIEGY